ncbi:MAG: LLM class flavin-dependent oxidoreductase [Acidimicrobiia bacterium]|nr:LLM class flavin-dependent oxidoreductase [Acidimicrobiia bacterium]
MTTNPTPHKETSLTEAARLNTDPNSPVEISWFAALCDDDYAQLGVTDQSLRSSWGHCRDIALTAEHAGFDNILLPSGYELGIDSVSFAGGMAPLLKHMQMLVAVRCGEMWAPQLARQLATLDQMLDGRLTINIISSDMPGETLESAARYRRTLETMQVLRALLNGEDVAFHGEFINLEVTAASAQPVSGSCPPLYFGGLSDDARDVAAQEADVYLMWPDLMPEVASIIGDMRERAAGYGRALRFGYRAHVIVRETDEEAHAAAAQLVEALDPAEGKRIRERSLDHSSEGVRRQAELRESSSDDGFVEDALWTGVGRARSGCGAAIVGSPEQVISKLRAYQSLGIDAFILSGYPHIEEAKHFARLVLPEIAHAPLRSFADF